MSFQKPTMPIILPNYFSGVVELSTNIAKYLFKIARLFGHHSVKSQNTTEPCTLRHRKYHSIYLLVTPVSEDV